MEVLILEGLNVHMGATVTTVDLDSRMRIIIRIHFTVVMAIHHHLLKIVKHVLAPLWFSTVDPLYVDTALQTVGCL